MSGNKDDTRRGEGSADEGENGDNDYTSLFDLRKTHPDRVKVIAR
jgi:hypothetical protein